MRSFSLAASSQLSQTFTAHIVIAVFLNVCDTSMLTMFNQRYGAQKMAGKEKSQTQVITDLNFISLNRRTLPLLVLYKDQEIQNRSNSDTSYPRSSEL